LEDDVMAGQRGAALSGLRVLDLTQAMPGAVTTMLLADYGADVLRIDLQRRDVPQSVAGRRTWARGRRCLGVDPAIAAQRDQVLALATSADVVVTDLAPALARDLALDTRAVRDGNPAVVYVALTGFGLHDERPTPGVDALVAAELGAMNAATGANRDGPVFLGHPAIAYSTAFTAVIGTLAALHRRLLVGLGDVVDVSLLDGVLAQLTMNWWTEQNVSFLADRRPDGQLDLGRTRMLVRRYTCRDGRMIQVHTGAAGAFGRLMNLLGIDDRLSPATGPVEAACPLTDADLSVLEHIPAIFATRSAGEWLADLWANEVAALPVLTPAEVFDDDQVRHNDLVRVLDDPELGPLEVVAPPITLSATPAVVAPPDRTADGASWLAPGLSAGGTAPGTDMAHGPLTGIRVLELSTFFASPYANRFLRDLGAEVIKVEALDGDPMRSLPDPFEGVARGKRSVALDLKTLAGRAVVETLLGDADVLQHNFRPGAAERLGLDQASVRERHPPLIYDYAPGYGATGPKSRLQSFAPLLSGFVGIQVEAAGEGNLPTITFGNEDYYNGQLNAIGTLLALVHRDRTGEGQYVECPQLNSSVFVMSHWYRRAGTPHSALPALDHLQFGWSPYQRLYQCLDGYLCVCCTDAAHEQALRATVLGEAVPAEAEELAERLEYECTGRTASEWRDLLSRAGVPCTLAVEHMWLYVHLTDAAAQAAGRATAFTHHRAGRVSVIGQIVRLESARPREPVRAPLLGEHTIAVLTEAGLGDDAIADLLAGGTVYAPGRGTA
jgi:crotonobetainyl-CoA:carnitine CoA-transferase CaiB-like acyl-CoA transferase